MLRNQIKYIKQLAKYDLVAVILFENTELQELLDKRSSITLEIDTQTIAKKSDYEKPQITFELQKLVIQCICTTKKKLTVNTLNKYLELKAWEII